MLCLCLLNGVLTPLRGARPKRSRRFKLLEELSVDNWTAVEEVMSRAGASPAAIRRDLRVLEAKGVVRREHGAARLAEPVTFEPFLDNPGFSEQVHRMARERRRIGIAAEALIRDGETVSISSGTTTMQIVQALSARKYLTVVTNAVNVAMELSRSRAIRVHLPGGYLGDDWFSLVGPQALESIRTLFTDKAFFGANGVHSEHGVTGRHIEEASMNQSMARQARKRIVVVDHTKFGQIAKHVVCPIRDIDVIVTDTGASDTIAPFESWESRSFEFER
jgi:DeoR/GlpR family transcriptional regulator of sugar metabolism